MSLAEYAGWQRYLAKRPPEAVEILLAHLCAMFHNAHRDPKKGKPADLAMFAPWLAETAAKADEADQRAYRAVADDRLRELRARVAKMQD